ncbi:MAG: hypothetical protein NVS4B3_24470 [Gemmatimonadaceae bacterium]
MRTIPIAGILAAAVIGGACADGGMMEPPLFNRPRAVAPLAAHFDTLRRDAVSRGEAERAGALSAVELALLDGASPSPLSLDLGSGARFFQALVVAVEDQPRPEAPAQIFFRELVAWRGEGAEELVTLVARADSSAFGASALGAVGPRPEAQLSAASATGPIKWVAGDGFLVDRPATVDGECTRADDPAHPQVSCRRAGFVAALNATFFPSAVIANSALPPVGPVHVVGPLTSIAGVRLTRRCDLSACVSFSPTELTPPTN